MGGGIDVCGYLPHIVNSSLVDLHCSRELFAEHNGFSTARDEFYCPTARVASFLELTSLELATLSM
jgi:hypothetical protein